MGGIELMNSFKVCRLLQNMKNTNETILGLRFSDTPFSWIR